MANETSLISAQDVKTRLVGRIREDIGNLIPEEQINKVIEEAKQEFLNEIKTEVKKILKTFYDESVKNALAKLRQGEYNEQIQRTTYKELEDLLKRCGFDEYSLMMHNAALMTINRLADTLRNSGINIGYF